MQYLCLCHYDAAQFATLGPKDFEAIGAIWVGDGTRSIEVAPVRLCGA